VPSITPNTLRKLIAAADGPAAVKMS
jgi:hypothetical protein